MVPRLVRIGVAASVVELLINLAGAVCIDVVVVADAAAASVAVAKIPFGTLTATTDCSCCCCVLCVAIATAAAAVVVVIVGVVSDICVAAGTLNHVLNHVELQVQIVAGIMGA